MAIESMIEAGIQGFKKNLEAFCAEAAEGPLSPDSAREVSLGVQKALSAAGAAAYRSFLESKDEARDVVVRDGEVFRFKYDSQKTYIGFWGETMVSRRLYQNASDTKTFVPLDAAWDMEDEFLMADVREAAAFSCAHMTPEETAALFRKSALFRPHATQIKRALERLGEHVAARREDIDDAIREGEAAPEGTRILAASMDGTCVPLRKHRETPEDRASEYKTAMVGSVSFYGGVPSDETSPERLESRYVAHMPEERFPAFKARFEAELLAVEKQAPDAVKVLICDGARSLWKYIEASECFADYEAVLDYWHAAEHLALAADALFGKGSDEAKAWFAKYRRVLLDQDDGAERVLRSMAYFAKRLRLPGFRAVELSKQRVYFRNNKKNMRYAEFRRRGLPIGSGPVEAACKTLVKTRLARSGQRWSIEGGQRILDLRAYAKSGRWDAFWKHQTNLRQTEEAA